MALAAVPQASFGGLLNRNRCKPPQQKRFGPAPERTPLHCLASSTQQNSNLTLDDLKAKLVRSVANTNRGRATTSEQRREILGLIQDLEGRNAVRRPAESDLLSGRWSLLYQVPLREEDAGGANPNTMLEGPVLARMRPLAGGAVQSKGITQVIDVQGGGVENIADFAVLGVAGQLNIRGTCAPSPPSEDPEAARVDVEFVDFQLSLGSLKATLPLSWAKPKGWVQTTYLDQGLRVGRGDKGSIFLTARQQPVKNGEKR